MKQAKKSKKLSEVKKSTGILRDNGEHLSATRSLVYEWITAWVMDFDV